MNNKPQIETFIKSCNCVITTIDKMITKKTQLFIGIFAFLLLSLSFASAALAVVSPTSISLSANHNTQIAFPDLLLNNTDSAQNISVTGFSFSNFGSINSGNITGLPATPFQLLANQSVTKSGIIVNIPQYTSPGAYPGTYTIYYTNGTSSLATSPNSFTVTVNTSKSISISQSTSLTRTQNGSITLTNTGNTALSGVVLSQSGTLAVNFSENNFILNPGAPKTIILSATSTELDKMKIGSNTVSIVATASDGTNNTLSYIVTGSVCKYGVVGNHLTITSIKDESSKDDWKWRPLDNVEVSVKVKNAGIDEISTSYDKSVMVRLILINSDGNQVTSFVEDTDKLEDEDSIDEGSSGTTTFKFQISADALADSNYKLYAKAYESGKENQQCISQIAEVSSEKSVQIKRNTREVIVKELADAPETANCGSTVDLTAKIYNIGNTDEDKVKVKIYNKDLGLNLYKEITSLDKGESADIPFSFDIPQKLGEKTYSILFSTQYDYDDNDDVYGKESDETGEYTYKLSVLGNCQSITTPDPTITARLVSETVEVGKDCLIYSGSKYEIAGCYGENWNAS